MDARELERTLLARCAMASRGQQAAARNRQEANVFRLAAMVVQSRFPEQAATLMQSSNAYFQTNPQDRLPAADVVRAGWLSGLPRLRDMLTIELRKPG